MSESKSRMYDGLWLMEPTQFLFDAMPRAQAYLQRFPAPPKGFGSMQWQGLHRKCEDAANPTRGEGQVLAPAVHTLNMKVGKVLRFGDRNLEVSASIFNLLNAGDYTEYARTGANRVYNPASFLTYTNPQTPPALQLEAVVRF